MATINTPLAAHMLSPAQYVVIDLETGDAPPDAIAAAIAAWKAPSNWKPETVEAKRVEAAEKIIEKSALLDASPILCLALKTDRMSVILNGMDASSPEIPGWWCLPCVDERGLLLALRTILDVSVGTGTVIAGHNIVGFDLPKLRNAFLRQRLKLPDALAYSFSDFTQPAFDTMRQARYFSMEHYDERYVSLDAVARVWTSRSRNRSSPARIARVCIGRVNTQ